MDTQESAAEENILRIKNTMETEEEDEDGITQTQFSQRSSITSSNPKSQITKVIVADPVKELTGSENKSHMVEIGNSKLLTKDQAEDIRSSLDPAFPSFVKLMLKSHVTGGFWLGLPSKFCAKNMSQEDISMTLLDEEGEEHIAKYLAGKCGLSGGWRGFSIAHKLVEGDAVVFQLIKINKFKVYIVRTTGLAEVDGALGLLQLEACARKSSLGEAGNDLKLTRKAIVGEHPKRLPLAVIRGKNEVDGALGLLQLEACAHKGSLGKAGNDMKPTRKAVLGKRLKHSPLAVTQGKDENISPPLSVTDQPENGSEEADSDFLGGIKFASSVTAFQDIKNSESFTIIVNDLIIDSEMSKHVKSKYYELCCSQNSFLHENLMPGLNCKLVAGIISETINIADAIRCSKVGRTSRDDFAIWRKTLEAFEHLGMNVGFLLPRLDELVKLASESEQTVDLKRYREATIERTLAEEEMKTLEMKLVELKDASKMFEKDIKTLKVKAEKYESDFEAEANAPW
ncbi:hypothetical protein C5167_038588 [Papaver somniferum]|uniref:TF-B3 domain-containing protein n=1 Tax=Papaver somniferum TaxID=3469 RepID=A0A4Y7I9M1_PAPSO|nr:B3 domain-containing protein Os01g0234100-like isoform X2 [Papaver somniferum]RZC45637.1 hypothetical protein C5167_038588 [Papaver somniferum]